MSRWGVLAGGAVLLAASGFILVRAPANTENYVRPPTTLSPASTASIIFGGDMMFDRTIRTTMEEKGGDFIFSCIDEVLRSADFVVANLEGPITSFQSRSVGTAPGEIGNYTFTFPTSTAELLFRHNIYLVNLGNNHIMNFGREGLLETKKWLDASRVRYFGLPAEASAQAGDPRSASVVREEIHGVRLAFINYNEFVDRGSASTTLEQITLSRAEGYIPIVYTHWGIEYATTSAAYSRELAHSLVDVGAEIVIGSHSHVVQEHEVYGSTTLTTGQDKHIYYSLGNFIFDQYWNEDVRSGLLLKVMFNSKGVQSIEEIPIHLERDRRTCPVESD